MNRQTTITATLLICILLPTSTQAKSDDTTEVPTISVTKLDINDKTLKLIYEIRNDLNQDVWICDSVSQHHDFEVYLDEDGRTLLVRKRLDVTSSAFYSVQPWGKYSHLCPGERRIESLWLALPARPIYLYKSRTELRSLVNATRVSIEIGYYVGRLPYVVVRMLEETDKSPDYKSELLHVWFGGVVGFNSTNESLGLRSDEILIPYTHQILAGEKILRTTIDDLTVPYRESTRLTKSNPPDLTSCTRVKIEYEPSMLDYFYRYQSEQDLLDREEIEYLRTQKTIVIEDSKRIKNFASELQQTEQGIGGITSANSRAYVSCSYAEGRVISLFLYADTYIETEHGHRIKYYRKLQSLRKFTPQIQPFELRMYCAANLRNLWNRLRLYDRAEKTRIQSYGNIKLDNPSRHYDPNKIELEDIPDQSQQALESFKNRMKELQTRIKLVYPAPQRWCDALERAFAGLGNYAGLAKGAWHDPVIRIHVCPTFSEGRSTYAMNPNCRYDSPTDMVLLFETKAGWNQHGGPELFTFDNHDPRGGCVLLNDGTVKFIRTKEELQQLQWK